MQRNGSRGLVFRNVDANIKRNNERVENDYLHREESRLGGHRAGKCVLL